MKVHQIPSRLSGPLMVFCFVAGVVGPTSFLVGGPTGLAWGLGWGLSAGLGWALLCNTRWGLVQGLSAGLCVGVGLGSFTLGLGLLQGIVLRGLFWGALGGIVGMLAVRSVSRTGFGGFLAGNLVGALATGVLGTVVVGVIGDILEGFTLSGAGFVIGVVFMGPCWALGTTAGIIIGHLVSKKR